MKARLVILTEIISPYRIPLFNDLARHPGIDLHVIFLAETDPALRQWRVYKEDIQFSYEVLPSSRMHLAGFNLLINRKVWLALSQAHPDAILCGGYNYVASWQALAWARRRNVVFLLWSESHLRELRRPRPLVEFVKDEFLHRCDGSVVSGTMAREYLRARKIPDARIFTAPNAVDNQLFSEAAAIARREAVARRGKFGLPSKYFLFTGRLVREKGPSELLGAYASMDPAVRKECGLVLAGDGVCRTELEREAAAIAPGTIKFAGFVHREELASYYALAEALILPTYTDTWGLVVNEAMACGLPVILSNAAGCSVDLVKENWNGLVIPPRNARALAEAMNRLASDPDLRAEMGQNSIRKISEFSPSAWSQGVAKAIHSIGVSHA